MSNDRFRGKPPATISAKSLDSLGKDAESAGNIIAKKKRLNVFLPPVDYASASNFAVYGSAEKYYEDAVKRIYLEYPYDGSEKEINEYILSSSYLDQYVLDRRYPRTTGYVNLAGKNGWGTVVASSGDYGATATSSYEYINFFGGPHTTLSSTTSIVNAFTGSHNQNNVFDLSKNRGSNLALDPVSGSTVEFWLRKTAFVPTKTKKEVIFDLWNGKESYTDGSYGRFMIELTASGITELGQDAFRLTYLSGTTGFTNQPIGSSTVTTSSIADFTWNHYAISVASSSDNGFVGKLYINGELNESKVFAGIGTLSEVTGAMQANLGALVHTPPGSDTYPVKGWGKVTASFDEFRYWKTERSAEDVGRNWWTQVRGGTNTDDANTDLGVYFKFNEGITGDTALDSTVLDYSGRITNGSWTGYTSATSRNTGSAIVISKAAKTEFKDPIIYPTHNDVSDVLAKLRSDGRIHDQSNNSSIFNSLPAWITENDSSGDLKNLVQIIASYFDRLQNQIREVPRLKNLTYLSSSHTSPTFASDLVNSTGMFASEIFIDSNIMEQILSRDEDRSFELDLEEIRNRIYQNIYNNLIFINKAKGTEKAFRNLIHCYGIDEKLIRLNTYGDENTYTLRDNFRSTVVAKNLVDFSDPSRNSATIYQMTGSGNSDSVSFISGTAGSSNLGGEDYIGFTLESEFVLPLTPDLCETTASIRNPIVNSSVFGMHSANGDSPGDTTWPTNDYADLRVLAVRPNDDFNTTDASFKLESTISGIATLTSSVFKDAYDNNKWNIGVRVINDKYPLGDLITGVSLSGAADPHSATKYRLEFYGVNQLLDVTREEFFLTGTIGSQDALNLLRSDKRVFAGAHRTNFSGALLQRSDIKLSSVKYWSNYISNETIKAHARDTDNYGTLNPHRNAFGSQTSVTGTYIPEIETLALNWNFYNLTGSDSSGMFEVLDNSSGSVELQKRYGWLGNIVKAQHTAIGRGFPSNDLSSIRKEYIYSAKQVAPEIVQTSEMINILDRDDENFTRDQRPIKYFFSIEKSMYQVISDEMLNTFATILEFNNLIGDPINRYRQDYKLLEKARSLYFEDVENTPDLDRFIDFYKWIDSSLSNFLQQLIPASADSSDSIRTLIESHVLERNKYWSKFPTLEKKIPGGPGGLVVGAATMGGAASEGAYRSRAGSNFAFDSAPIPYVESSHATYWRNRASRLVAPLATGIAGVDNDRQSILEVLQTGYNRDTKRPFVMNKNSSKTIRGGINYPANKKSEIILNATRPAGPIANSGTPLNTFLVDDGGVDNFESINDVIDPNQKRFYSFICSIRREDESGIAGVNNATYTSRIKGSVAAPFRLVSGSVEAGYNAQINDGFKAGTILTNLHNDAFILNERALQGPFTDAHVGGHQSRHIDINRYDSDTGETDTFLTRPEAWKILIGSEYGSDSTMLGLVGPDYPFPTGPYPFNETLKATRYRNVGTKRPVNIRNIKYTTGSAVLGNYSKDYEIVQTSGRSVNNKYFIDNDGIELPELYRGISTTTTNYLNTKQVFALSGTLGAAGAPGYRVLTNSSLNDPTAFSFSMWLSCSNATAQSTDRYLISIGSDNLSAFGRAMYIDTSNKMILKLGYTTTDGVWTSDSVIWSSAGWHHFAMTYNNGDGDANFYINGSEAGGSFTTAPAGTFETPGSDSTLLCRRNNSSGVITNNTSFYSGSIAECSYWDKKLNSSEVSEIYSRANADDNPGPQDLTEHSAAGNLVSWWRFGEDSSDTETSINDQVSSNDAAGIATAADNGMELGDLTAADLLIAGGGTFSTTRTGYLPQTTNVNTLIGINPQVTNAGNYFGNIQTSPSTLSNRFIGTTNYSVRGRSSNNYIFAGKFSAPGGPEINSLGYLDIMAEEKSVYNALPFRNLSVRSSGSGEIGTIRADNLNRRVGLRTLLSEHAEQFGAALGTVAPKDSIGASLYNTIPSWHKVNRNTLRRIEFNEAGAYSSNTDNSFVTGTLYDNAFVSHAIPRSDYQYSWITASASPTRKIYGHAPADGFVSSSLKGIESAITFTDKSDVSAGGLNVDFANLNALIYDPIDLSKNLLTASSGDYRNTAFASLTVPEMLNALLIHRNGPYGINTWKQIRGEQRPLARKLRQSNIISFFSKEPSDYPLKNDEATPKQLRGDLVKFTEPPIQNKFDPIVQNLSIRATTEDGRNIVKKVDIETSYGNILNYFNNVELNNLLDEQVAEVEVPAYDKIRDLYIGDQANNPDSPVERFNSLTYKERVYPSSLNAFSSSVRVRQKYTNTFWRDLRSDRAQTNQFSFGETIPLKSMWSLDADSDFATREIHSRKDSTGGAGILQNLYSQVHLGTQPDVTGAIQYARRHTIQNARSVVGPDGIPLPATGSGYTTAAGYYKLPPEEMFGGQALWQTAKQSGKNPWYNSYDEYAKELRLRGKDYSVAPEFKISDHVETYIKSHKGNFLADNLDIFSVEGGETHKDSSSETSFYKTYSNSDFLKYFGVIRDDLRGTATPSSLKLTCEGLVKFLPYDGFYPSERTVQIAEMFSSSYGNYINYSYGSSGNDSGTGFKTFISPLFAPGVLYNTIKSGIAVDYPIMTSSWDSHTIANDTEGSTKYLSGSDGLGLFGYRVPFEALVEPESYVADIDIYDLETHPSAAINVTASWSGQGGNLYKLMANNFLAESVDLFLPEGKLTTIASKPEDQWESAETGRVYGARIKMRKSYNRAVSRTGSLGYYNPLTPVTLWRQPDFQETFTMYSRPSAFGPPVGAGSEATSLYGSTNGFNPCFTPPYYYGEAWADVFWTSNKTGQITAEDITNTNGLAISYIRIGNEWSVSNTKQNTSQNTLLHNSNIESNSMQLDASLNLFARAETKKITYDTKDGKPISAEDGGPAVLTIQTKFETPMLNFTDVSYTNGSFATASVAKGMWHQYGQLPSSPDIGVFLSITDIPDNYIEKALGGVPSLTGSLIDLLGFKTEEQRLGEVAETKVIREAVVAIPYVEKSGQRSFFEISKKQIDEALLDNPTVSDSIKNMVDSMKRYVFPPKLDFVKNSDSVTPFAMYIFEFEHVLDQEDLVDIWQGLPPKIGQSFDANSNNFKSGKGPHTSQIIKEVEISHPLVVGELLNNDTLPSNLRWMVFKVKQKAQTNYFDKVIKDQANNGTGFNRKDVSQVGRKNSAKASTPDYSYNWPYDFFSLVELVKLNAEIDISNDESK